MGFSYQMTAWRAALSAFLLLVMLSEKCVMPFIQYLSVYTHTHRKSSIIQYSRTQITEFIFIVKCELDWI